MRETKEIKITGTIVPNDDKWIYDWFKMEAACPRDVEKGLAEAGNDDVILRINSGGGEIGAGNEMAYLISKYPGNITAEIVGFCCSAATLPACAAKTAKMTSTSLYMIHNVSTCAAGDHQVFTHEAGVLKTASEAIAGIYQEKTGKTAAELEGLMNAETWMNAEQAKAEGFIDEIITLAKKPTTFVNSAFGQVLAPDVIEKIRASVKNPEQMGGSGGKEKQMAIAKLNLLKERGKQYV